MAAPHQNIADVVVLKTPAVEADLGGLKLDSDAPVGLKLAAMRKAKGLTHAEVHAGTKIKVVHIAAIETGDKAALPATPFTAGFVKAYAQFLGLDADAFARAYKQEAGFAPLAAPVQAAIIKEVMQARAAETAPIDPPATPVAPLMKSTALLPVAAPHVMQALESPSPVPAAAVRLFDADKMVTWLGAGAAIAVVAFIAGRAAQPAAVANEDAPVPSVIVEALEPITIEPPTLVVDPPPQVVEPIENPPAIAAIKPPAIKPKPKKRVAQKEPPAPVEITPAPAIISVPVVEAPAEPAPAPEPKIVPARVTRGAAALYPERCATRAGAKVDVSVIFSITTEGKPISASVASTDNRCFNSAALRAVYEMRFSPRTVDGARMIETGKTVTVQFVR